VEENNIPVLLLNSGDTVDGGPLVNEVFVSLPGVIYERNGVTCSGCGKYGPAATECVYSSGLYWRIL